MKLLRFLTTITMTLSMVGCCCGRNVVSDCCDPCGGMSPGRGLIRFPGLRSAFGGYSSCGCDSCGTSWSEFPGDGGCSSCGSPMMSTYDMPSSGGGGCNCGSNSSPSSVNYPPAAVPTTPTPLPSTDSNSPAAPAPPIPPTTPGDIPSASSTMIPPSAPPATQMVSYEEFQKLPGTVISGPGVGTSSAPAASPRLFNRSVGNPSQPMMSAQGQSQVWVQAK